MVWLRGSPEIPLFVETIIRLFQKMAFGLER